MYARLDAMLGAARRSASGSAPAALPRRSGIRACAPRSEPPRIAPSRAYIGL